ncbi:MAG: M20/M25/M40 family metallo-hydrolase [Planctomycetota bacterium]
MPLQERLREILSLPTAPFHEGAVHGRIREAVRASPHLRDRVDGHGNLEVVHGKGRPSLLFACHTDHPALEVDGPGTAVIVGGIRADALAGSHLVTFDGAVRPRVSRVIERGERSGGRVRLTGAKGLKKGTPLLLDLPGVSIAGGKVRARAIDDGCAVAACLAVMDALAKSRWKGTVGFLFTRAEEVGFAGAMGWARSTRYPKSTTVINLEMSSARPHTPQGAGPILRVGDRLTVYDDAVSLGLEFTAVRLAKRNKEFRYQRALMDGGACEASVYARAGFFAGALCLPLKNYHNHAARGGGVAREYVSLDDAENLVRWMVAIAKQFGQRDPAAHLERRFDKLYKKHGRRLKRTAQEGEGN